MPNWESDPNEAGYDPGVDPDYSDYTKEYNEGYSDPDTGDLYDSDGNLDESRWLYGKDHTMSANECRWAGTWYSADELAYGLTDAQIAQCDKYGKEGYYNPLKAPDGLGDVEKYLKYALMGGAVFLGLRLGKVI